MAEKKITITLKAINIGPHSNLDSKLHFSSLKIGVFGNNGIGKTFISRMFRLVSDSNAEKANKVLSINKNSGSFSFQIDEKKDAGDSHQLLEIKVSKNNEPEISNGTKYIYHVFNSDYVKENIEEMKYLPDGDIEGYILGKTKIDLSKEKAKLSKLESQIKENGQVFKEKVELAKKELDTLKVNKNTQEYKFTYGDIYKNTLSYKDEESFEDLKSLNKVLSRVPDNLPNITEVKNKIDISFLDGLSSILINKYSKSSFAKEFKEKIETKLVFITEGLTKLPKERMNWGKCPFCEQELQENAKSLIDDYVTFLDDEESKVKTKISYLILNLDSLGSDLTINVANLAKASNQLDTIKQYIPSQANVSLALFDNDDAIRKSILFLKGLLETKKIDIGESISIEKFKNEIQIIKNYIETIDKTTVNNNKLIPIFNSKKENISGEKLGLNRRLCKALYQKIQIDVIDLIDEIKELVQQKEELAKDVAEKESQEKVSKKEKVTESLKYYLNCFFGEKYTFDEDNFCLKFHAHLMSENATDILSEGEKRIVAFCFYLSDMHKVISKESDYENLFLIIDDPISSLDFHYVYSVTQILRSLQNQLNVKQNRFIIFTHNLEFMSILIRNKIIKEYVVLADSQFRKLSRELVMPYEEHLRDINSVTKGQTPTHTTPNSVRHVLETIHRFESPNIGFKDYIDKEGILCKNEFVYSLIHDSSHGIIRQQKAYTDEMIINGCKVVIEFVKRKFEGQIKQIELK